MVNNTPFGLTLIVTGLAILVSALNKTTGSMVAGLIYGHAGMQDRTSSSSGNPYSNNPNGAVAVTPAQADDAWKNPYVVGGTRAGVVPWVPSLGGIPGLLGPVIPPKSKG